MSDLQFSKISETDSETLAEWLSQDTWPYFMYFQPKKEDVLRRIREEKAFFGDGSETFWITMENRKIGLLEIYELNEDAPMFSLRFKENSRGKGYGPAAVKWLTEYIFTNYPELHRIEAQTREDNIPMRKLFNKSGYVKEAYYREAIPTESGEKVASVAYGMLRKDWSAGSRTPVSWSTDKFFSGDN